MSPTRHDARLTGIFYLGLAVFGMLGFLVIRPQVFVTDPALTLENLTTRAGLAHLAVAMELLVVITQALAAWWFFRLFAPLHRTAAVGVMIFGMANACAIMLSAAFLATANGVALGDVQFGALAATDAVSLLQALSENTWAVGAIFFGLWLLPMGWAVLASGRMPRVLGWLLVVGGVGYTMSSLLDLGWHGAPALLVEGLSFLATVGELWMVVYLLTVGIRPERLSRAAA